MRAGIAPAALLLATALHAGSAITATKAALATASPISTSVGLSALKRGGNAIDAAVAVSFALAALRPEWAGVGGGGYLLYYEAETGGVWALDFSETAPAAARADMFARLPESARKGAQSCGVPGMVSGLASAHERFGSRPWDELLGPAMVLAREGPRPDKELSATIARLATFGASDFYTGATAEKIVSAVRAAGGLLSLRDLRDYKPVWRAPLQIEFRGTAIYVMPPPSGGGMVLAEALQILSAYDLAGDGFQTPRSIHLQVEALRRAFIDQEKYLGDPALSRIPYRDLLSTERAAQWRHSIDENRSTPTVTLTQPGETKPESAQTTHFSILDEQGNLAAVTLTLHDDSGSGLAAAGTGVLLNNAMSAFSAAPRGANGVESGKRPATYMSPLIALRGGKPVLALGTPGGATIPTTVLQVLLNNLVHGKPLAAAVAAPRYHHQADPEDVFYETDRAPRPTVDALSAMGHGVRSRESIGDVQAIAIEEGTITAVADPRQGGAAGGY